MGVGSRNHRYKLQHGKGKGKKIGEHIIELGGNIIDEHDGDKKKIKEISETVNHQLQNALPTLKSASKPSTIGRAPTKFRRLHEHGFNPTHVAIGPLHPPVKQPSFMEEDKLRFLDRLLKKMTIPHVHDQEQNGTSVKLEVEKLESQQPSDQTAGSSSSSSSSTNPNQKKIEYLVVEMTKLEAYTRACYSESTSHKSSNEYVRMMIIDGCFVVELLRIYAKWGSDIVDDPIFYTRWVVPTLKQDLIMLENQLPFRVLEKIFDITRPDKDESTLKDLTLRFFNSLLSREEVYSGKCKVDDNPDHLLGLFRSSFKVRKELSSGNNRSRLRSWIRIPSLVIHSAIRNIKTCLAIRNIKTCLGIPQTDRHEQDPSPPWVHEGKFLIHCASELKEAGISFEKREKHDLLDIDFKNGKLYIPPLLIDDYTGLMFLNFVAYEQCYPSTEPYFTTYLLFWDCLLNSAKDVEYLHSKGIIYHVLGSDEDVAQLFNKLCREVAHDLGDCYLRKVFKDVNDYFGVTRHRWRAKWMHDYFNSPWAFISLTAAVFLLILTFIQTLFTVFPYVFPPS